jgi:hypothetical protein
MKARLLDLLNLLVVTTLLVPGGAGPVAATQSQLTSPITPTLPVGVSVPSPSDTQADDDVSARDQAHVADVLHSAPLMFVENVGQFDEGARFQVRGGNATIYLADDAVWITVVEDAPVLQSLPPNPQAGTPSRARRPLARGCGWRATGPCTPSPAPTGAAGPT